MSSRAQVGALAYPAKTMACGHTIGSFMEQQPEALLMRALTMWAFLGLQKPEHGLRLFADSYRWRIVGLAMNILLTKGEIFTTSFELFS